MVKIKQRRGCSLARVPARNFTGLVASLAGGRKGGGGGECGLLIGVARGRNGRAFMGNEEGRELLRGGNGHRRRKRLGEGDDRWVPPVGEGGGRKRIPLWVLTPGGPWAVGRNGSMGPFSIFFYFLFFFSFSVSISFITFVKLFQINSNHFQEFSKNQHNV
jgi:hypothetical protein